MEFFKKYFTEVDDWSNEEVKVCCPFHSDERPSASINTSKSLFHCWVCDIGYSEEQFIARINNISNVDALKFLDKYNDNKYNWNIEKGYLWADNMFLNKVRSLGLSDETIEKMNLGLIKEENSLKKYLGIPIYYNNYIVDVRRYNIMRYEGQPKMRSNEGSNTGWLIPYNDFVSSNETCYLFEGEKDMMMARDLGINAYTLTGGAGAKPNDYVINSFKDKNVIICYDNDEPGKDGMLNIFKNVKDLVKSIKYINIGDVVKEVKEDFYDYINKYNGNVF
jgi:DNA primase